MTLGGVTVETFDEANFKSGVAKTFGGEPELVQILDVSEVSRRRSLLASGVKVDFQIVAVDASDATMIAAELVKESNKGKMLESLKAEGVPVTSIVAVESTSVDLDSAAPTRAVHGTLLVYGMGAEKVTEAVVTEFLKKESKASDVIVGKTPEGKSLGEIKGFMFNVTGIDADNFIPFLTMLRVMPTAHMDISGAGIYATGITHPSFETCPTGSTWMDALKVHEGGESKKAISMLHRILECTSHAAGGKEASTEFDANNYNILGFITRNMTTPDLVKSEIYYKRALQLSPLHTGALGYLGELYMKLGKNVLARSLLATMTMKACPKIEGECEDRIFLMNKLNERGVSTDLPTAVDVVKSTFTVATELLTMTGLVSTIGALKGSYTLFLPTDDAFRAELSNAASGEQMAAMSAKEVASMLLSANGEEAVKALLLNHVMPDAMVMSYDVGSPTTSVKMAGGSEMVLSKDSNEMLMNFGSDVIVLPAYINMVGAPNGPNEMGAVIHGVSGLIFPPPAPSAPKEVQIDYIGLYDNANARSMTAELGTTLVFEWTGRHNVYEMASKEAFEKCDFTNAKMLGDTSPLKVTIDKVPVYYACEIGSHCSEGQKLAVTSSGAPAPTTTPAAPTMTAMTTTMKMTTTTTKMTTTAKTTKAQVKVVTTNAPTDIQTSSAGMDRATTAVLVVVGAALVA